MRALSALIALPVVLCGCLPDDTPTGIRPTPDGDGARVVFDRRNQPLPDIPFPNDLVTRPDARARTGIRLNLSAEATIGFERALREEALSQDGFGTFAQITVRFDGPLDFQALHGAGRDFADDPVLLVDVSPGPHFGERIPLDLGRGYLPATRVIAGDGLPADPKPDASTLLFETVDEDLDRDGVLAPREDLDGDGVLDRPNVATEGADPDRELMTWYERETNTLILRPIVPLRPARTYAVVLTERVRDAAGNPVRSPFLFIHHTQQTQALADLESALAPHGVTVAQVAFTWTFTTASQAELRDIASGLDGEGALAALADGFPPTVDGVENALDDGQVRVDGGTLAELVVALSPHLFPDADPVALAATYGAVDYLVAGQFTAPDYLDQLGFIFDLGESVELPGAAPVPFWCVVPRAREDARPPFPVVFFAHDHRAARHQSLLYAGALAERGLATCALDSVGQGVLFSATARSALDTSLGALEARAFRRVVEGFRARDLNNDERPDPGGGVFTADLLRTRDVLRQSVVDWLQFTRVVRGFDGTRRWRVAGIESAVAGDFDADGAPDLGGPDVPLYFMGVGYGGALAVVAAGVDGGFTAVAPIASGGGWADMAFRGGLPGMAESFLLPSEGPFIAGPSGAGLSRLTFLVNDLGQVAHTDPQAAEGLPFAELRTLLVPGDRVVVTNETSGETALAVVDGNGRFRVGVRGDALDAAALADLRAVGPDRTTATAALGDGLIIEIFDTGGRLKETVERFSRSVTLNGVTYRADDPLVALTTGWGIPAHGPRLRRYAQIVQTVLDPVDPLSYARDLAVNGTRIGVFAIAGDPQFPTGNAIALARAAGVLTAAADGAYVDEGVTEGVPRHGDLVDVDNLSEGLDRVEGPRWDVPIRATFEGENGDSGLRIFRPSQAGAHSLGGPDPSAPWDDATYLLNLLGQFFVEGSLQHRECLATRCP